MLAQRRTVSESKRAKELRTSTGNIRIQSDQWTPPVNVFAYLTGPWCRRPCQLKYTNVMIAQARGTVTFAVGELRNGNAPNKFASKINSATDPTMGTYCSQCCQAFSDRKSTR